jgi:hypothetical protein
MGFIFLLKGASVFTLSASIGWLIVAGVLVVYEISKKEERT